ncbi:hypothetical protein CFRS1_v011479 [Colletotrichum fructicola]|nr:hypothetical protein CFRS1_v011479 [Colletotrichum fructicola]
MQGQYNGDSKDTRSGVPRELSTIPESLVPSILLRIGSLRAPPAPSTKILFSLCFLVFDLSHLTTSNQQHSVFNTACWH